jgi:hypothetical protein
MDKMHQLAATIDKPKPTNESVQTAMVCVATTVSQDPDNVPVATLSPLEDDEVMPAGSDVDWFDWIDCEQGEVADYSSDKTVLEPWEPSITPVTFVGDMKEEVEDDGERADNNLKEITTEPHGVTDLSIKLSEGQADMDENCVVLQAEVELIDDRSENEDKYMKQARPLRREFDFLNKPGEHESSRGLPEGDVNSADAAPESMLLRPTPHARSHNMITKRVALYEQLKRKPPDV